MAGCGRAGLWEGRRYGGFVAVSASAVCADVERISAESERRGTAAYRDRVLAGLSGRVMEVSAQRHELGHYPDTVEQVVAVEPDDHLQAFAPAQPAPRAAVPAVQVFAGHRRAAGRGPPAVIRAVARRRSVLCSVSNMSAALARLHWCSSRLSQVRFLQHVRSDRPSLGCCRMRSPRCGREWGGSQLPGAGPGTPLLRSAPAGWTVEVAEFVCAAAVFSAHAHILGRARLGRLN